MNDIEQGMLEALESGTDWRQGNTAVEFIREGKAVVSVYNKGIAHVDTTGTRHEIEVQRRVLREHASEAACSRLRALGVAATMTRKKAYINNEPA